MQFFPANSKSFLPEVHPKTRIGSFSSAFSAGKNQAKGAETPFADSITAILSSKLLGKDSQSPQNTSPFKPEFLSFIEEGRTDYTGLPMGFSAHIVESGTLSRDTAELFKEKLRSKDVHELSIEGVNQLISSGGPLQVSVLFSTLAGNRRITPELTEEERVTFRQFMGTLHAHQDETETMLSFADTGKQQPLLTTFMQKAMDVASDSISVSRQEMHVLLKGMDLSSKSSTHILEQFKDQDSLVVSKEELTQLMSAAKQEIHQRNEAASHTARVMRTAMVETLNDAKIKEYGAPIADIRGSHRSNQIQMLMQDSTIRKTGLRALFTDQNEEESALDSADDLNAIHMQTNKHALPEEKTMPSLQEKSYSSAQQNEESRDFFQPKAAKTVNSTTSHAKENLFQAHGDISYETNALSIATNQREGVMPHPQAPYASNIPHSNAHELLAQIENAIAQGKATGSNQMSLQFSSEGLGQLTLMLHVRYGEVRATIRTEQHESAVLLGEQLDNIKALLEEKGLTVTEIKVQTTVSDNNSSNGWNNADPHNQMHDAQERDRKARLTNMRLANGHTEKNPEPEHHERTTPGPGLHIVA